MIDTPLSLLPGVISATYEIPDKSTSFGVLKKNTASSENASPVTESFLFFITLVMRFVGLPRSHRIGEPELKSVQRRIL